MTSAKLTTDKDGRGKITFIVKSFGVVSKQEKNEMALTKSKVEAFIKDILKVDETVMNKPMQI